MAQRRYPRLSWPIPQAPNQPVTLLEGENRAPFRFPHDHECIELRFDGQAAAPGTSCSQAGEMQPMWIGMRGEAQRLTVIVHNEPGRSPHYWNGPKVEAGRPFDIHLKLHAGMGPGGILFKLAADRPWSSMSAASAWGAQPLGQMEYRPRQWRPGRSAIQRSWAHRFRGRLESTPAAVEVAISLPPSTKTHPDSRSLVDGLAGEPLGATP
jgi:hypothetical protein